MPHGIAGMLAAGLIAAGQDTLGVAVVVLMPVPWQLRSGHQR